MANRDPEPESQHEQYSPEYLAKRARGEKLAAAAPEPVEADKDKEEHEHASKEEGAEKAEEHKEEPA